MTSVSSLSQYLNSTTTSTGLSNSASSALAEKLKATKSQTAEATTESSADGDQITLSASAKALLAAQEKTKTAETAKTYGFTLTTKQQSDLDAVVAKYKDKEINQTNYDAMQKDLKKLRLDTPNMAAKDSAKSFSLKGIMLSIMNGKDVSGNAAARAQATAAKSDAYAKQIVADWTALQTVTTMPVAT